MVQGNGTKLLIWSINVEQGNKSTLAKVKVSWESKQNNKVTVHITHTTQCCRIRFKIIFK